MILFLGVLSACTTPDPPAKTAMANVPFVAEGDLTFLRDGAPIVQITIEIADDDSTRTRGLMQRESLPELSGMLFIFPVEDYQSFWMANTQMSLDLVFVNGSGEIVSIARYAKPLSTEPVASVGVAQYVVELEAGFADSWGLIEGDRIEWKPY